MLKHFYSHISTRTFRRALTASLPGQLRGDKECPFSGVTKSGRVWRKVPESDARSVGFNARRERDMSSSRVRPNTVGYFGTPPTKVIALIRLSFPRIPLCSFPLYSCLFRGDFYYLAHPSHINTHTRTHTHTNIHTHTRARAHTHACPHRPLQL